ncbi:MAG: leucine-rich repeat protein [Clostridia bacterium]|nr:leucine-rich repeat protein [Clostridia bacterium]
MDYIIKDTTLGAIADSIRAKTGSSDPIAVSDMATQIEGITGGGGGGSVEGYATVTFMNGGEVLFSRMVLKGDDCPDPWVQKRIETPTKESTAQYDYTFNGWATADGGSADSNALKGITEDKTLYAAYASSVRKYTVTYYDTDGVTVLHTEQLAYGTTPYYVPTKDGAVFNGWTPKTPVTGNTSYTASWSAALASGSCGDTALWSLSTDYVLTISGTGATNSCPWRDTDYKTQIVEVVIEEGITALVMYSFVGCANIKAVTIPSTITSLGSSSFYNLSKIERVHIASLEPWLKCDASDGIDAAQWYVNGEAISALVIPESVTKIGRGTCKNWKITSVVFHDGVTDIGNEAFRSCNNLTSVTIPASVTTMGDNVFTACKSLESVVHLAPAVGKSQHNGCTNLKNVTLGENVTSIAAYAFSQCSALSSVIFEDTEGWKAGSTDLASTDLADSATAITYLTNTYRTANWTKT